MESLTEALRQASVFWIVLSVVISLWGYWLRAWRWKLLIDVEEQQQVEVVRVFGALMTGYFVNLLVPRAGEVARCGVLKKTDHLQMGRLLGTVILERTVDLLFLVSIVLLAFLLENNVFLSLIGDLVSLETLERAAMKYLPLFIGVSVLMGFLVFWILKRYRDRGIIKRLRHFVRDFIKGLRSIKHVKNQWGFWTSSTMIWVIYFLMMYFVALAIPSTAGLSPTSVLMVMVMGSIGMIAPVQGGIGTFHALVAFILVFYGLSAEEGKIFAVIIHSTQILTVLVLGMISSIFLAKFVAKEEPIQSSLR
jgi:uncharacterized protein (TIRG00374 family)